MGSDSILDRREAVPALIGRHEDFLIVSGLAGTSRDVAALTQDGAHTYTMAGAMGGACMIGLGLALARPDKRILVVTGDGELLMNVSALATIGVMNRPNLAVLCVDNAITARPVIRRATRASASTSKKSPPAQALSGRARSRSKPNSPTAPGCCARATAPPLCCCASNRPSRPRISAAWIPPPAVTAS
jgi:Thiamine pyrophosphate enzyme, C-terminal TPP binding domain